MLFLALFAPLSFAPPIPALSNGALSATFDARGLKTVSLLANKASVAVENDVFTFKLGAGVIDSSKLSNPTLTVTNTSHVVYCYASSALPVTVSVTYELGAKAAYLTKTLHLKSSTLHAQQVNLTVLEVAPFAAIRLSLGGAAASTAVVASGRLGRYVQFSRFGKSLSAMLTARNPYLTFSTDAAGANTLSYPPGMNFSSSGFVADSALLGLLSLSGRTLPAPAQPLDEAEQAAMVAAVRDVMVVPQSQISTVKINIGWTENDYQIDIATPEGRAEYKRIIDRAAQVGITTLLFAPQNSDVSSRANNTDAWGWEQLLWFGMGQRLRLGLWTPRDPLPASLLEMLAYFKSKGVRPVACERSASQTPTRALSLAGLLTVLRRAPQMSTRSSLSSLGRSLAATRPRGSCRGPTTCSRRPRAHRCTSTSGTRRTVPCAAILPTSSFSSGSPIPWSISPTRRAPAASRSTTPTSRRTRPWRVSTRSGRAGGRSCTACTLPRAGKRVTATRASLTTGSRTMHGCHQLLKPPGVECTRRDVLG